MTAASAQRLAAASTKILQRRYPGSRWASISRVQWSGNGVHTPRSGLAAATRPASHVTATTATTCVSLPGNCFLPARFLDGRRGKSTTAFDGEGRAGDNNNR